MVATLLIYVITVLILTVVADKDAADIQASPKPDSLTANC